MTEDCVYIVHALTTKYYKIGRTININGRLRGLQTATPFYDLVLEVVHYCEDYKQLEKLLHEKYSSQRLRESEWFDLTSSDLLFLTGETDDVLDSIGFVCPAEPEVLKPPRKGWSKHTKTIHDLFPSRQEDVEQIEEIEEEEKPEALPKRKSNVAPEEPTDGAIFCNSRYTAVEKLSADMAREIESALGTEKYEPEWSHALEDYADALDTYTGEDTFSVVL